VSDDDIEIARRAAEQFSGALRAVRVTEAVKSEPPKSQRSLQSKAAGRSVPPVTVSFGSDSDGFGEPRPPMNYAVRNGLDGNVLHLRLCRRSRIRDDAPHRRVKLLPPFVGLAFARAQFDSFRE
jgi:hypothetical protein